MFVAFQIPLADARPYVGGVNKLAVPNYLLGPDETREEFMRNFGPFEWRRQDPGDDWPAENVYCRAARGLRFVEGALSTLEKDTGNRVSFECAFRRYLSNGKAVARIEIGLARRARTPRAPLDGEGVRELMQRAFQLPVRVRGASGFDEVALMDAGPLLAAHVMRSTTHWKAAGSSFKPADWWVTPGRVLALLEYRPDEVSDVPARARKVQTTIPGLELHHVSFQKGRRITRAWLMQVDPSAERARVREIRLHLFRLHAEREALRQILRQIAQDNLALSADTDASGDLRSYFEKSLGFLRRTSVYGQPQSELLKTAYEFDNLFTSGDRASLLAALGDVGRHLRERLDAAAPDVNDDDEVRYRM
jgi:hypothetical protein